MAIDLITPKAACAYLNSMYYNNTLNTTHCISCFNQHLSQKICSFYTLHLLMDVHDMNSLQDNTPNEYFIQFTFMRTIMPNVYKLFLNITIQHVRLHFKNGLYSSFMEFEKDIDDIFVEINAYIPQFTTRSVTPTTRKKCWIFGAAFTVVSELVSAYCFYKSYTFRKNVKKTLHYILDSQQHFHQNILSNKRNLLSLAEITSSNFRDLQSDLKKLKLDNDIKFQSYLTKLRHTKADSVFYKNYVLYYVNILHHLDHHLVAHNNKVERTKSLMHMECRNFISGLHILASNRIPESILHAVVLPNILHGILQHLLMENMYTLLYGSAVNAYYNMGIDNSFIINNVLYITISLSLKHRKAPIMSIYGLYYYYMPMNMLDYKKSSSAYTSLKSAIHIFF